MMQKLEGKSISGGIAIGTITLYQHTRQVERRRIEDTEAETARFYEARQEAKQQLQSLYEKTVKEAGEENARIFIDVHQVMLDDMDYIECVEAIIRTERVNAEYAVEQSGEKFAEIFSAMDDSYMKERAADIRDISQRVVATLRGETNEVWRLDEPVILAADDLTPSETVQIDRSMVLAFVTNHGSSTSHTAILARTMGIPAVSGIELSAGELSGGDAVKTAVVDGGKGLLIIDPDEEILNDYQKKLAQQKETQERLDALRGMDNVTIDGQHVGVFANIGCVEDTKVALANDAGGIGLFRSEFLYLKAEHYPSEEEQYQAYRAVAEKMAEKKVVIRTLDIGADKKADYFELKPEENPAMGLRAIRLCLKRISVFKQQLRALFRAATCGNIAIMYPMIISVDEVRRVRKIADEVKAELDKEGIPHGNPEQGIMVETPAAVLISDELAKEVDFFSIGTNDLTQYTLACDRQNPELEDFNDPHHPAVLKEIQMTVESGHRNGIWVGICGELAADTTLTETFLRMGVDELSVSPTRILSVREAVRSVDLSRN